MSQLLDESSEPFVYKIILVGDAGVGKTQLLRRYLCAASQDSAADHEDVRPTIGVEFRSSICTADDGTKIQAHIWDTAGQERYHSITTAHYRNAAGVILVYDVTDVDSFEHAVGKWLEDVKSYSQEENTSSIVQSVMLLGNKTDLGEQISPTQAALVADKLGIQLAARSCAETGEGVVEAFEGLLRHVHRLQRPSSVFRKVTRIEPSEPASLTLEQEYYSPSFCCFN